MASAVPKKKTKTAQQWAWEFLRRNPEYRDAFQKLNSLNPEQRKQIEIYSTGMDTDKVDDEIVLALDVRFFDTSQLLGYTGKQKTVEDYIKQSFEMRSVLANPEVTLTVAEKFTLEKYSITRWCDPDIDLTLAELKELWSHKILLKRGLTRFPAADGFKTDDEISDGSGWYGFSVSEGRAVSAPEKADKRLRKLPKQDVWSGLRKGTDERAYKAAEDKIELSLTETQVGAVFDLRLPLEFQINGIRAALQRHHDDLVQSGFVHNSPKQADRFGAFSEYLKILDMLADELSHLDIAKKTDGRLTTKNDWNRDPKANKLVKVSKVVSRSKPGDSINQLTGSVRKKIERAISLRDHGYQALAFTA
jgi:Family of unknown function (DUF6499)